MRCLRSTDLPRQSLRTRSRVFSQRKPRTSQETNDQVLLCSFYHELMHDHCYSVYNMELQINKQAIPAA
jgi:hypothetical protein